MSLRHEHATTLPNPLLPPSHLVQRAPFLTSRRMTDRSPISSKAPRLCNLISCNLRRARFRTTTEEPLDGSVATIREAVVALDRLVVGACRAVRQSKVEKRQMQ